MKRGIIAAVIIIAVTAFAITVNITLENKTDILYGFAQAASADKIKGKDLYNEWEKQIIYFELFTDHGYFEKIDKQIKKLSILENEAYTAACKEITIDLIELKEHLSFSFGNIF